MADTNQTILSVVATTGTKLPDLAIKNGQLIFARDKQLIALDYNGKRTFYNQINILQTDEERQGLLAPVSGLFYFVVGTAVLWTYDNAKWISVTTPPSEIIFIGTSLPELGSENKLYVNKDEKTISVWDNETQKYVCVSDTTEAATEEDILALFQ